MTPALNTAHIDTYYAVIDDPCTSYAGSDIRLYAGSKTVRLTEPNIPGLATQVRESKTVRLTVRSETYS